MEKRFIQRYERTDFHAEALLEHDSKPYLVEIQNISLSGALISRRGIPDIQPEDEIIMPLKTNGSRVEIRGKVARCIGDEAGIRFL